MSFFDIILRRLEDRQTELAASALAAPQQRDAFEYGRMCGMYAGFEDAKNILVGIIEEKDRRDAEL